MSSLKNTPFISIGLPVHNGIPYVIEAIESVLAQSFTDFELILSDNASTDETERVCREYVSKDTRVRYSRTEHNVGAAANFNRLVDMSQGHYFKWLAADGVIEPTFLERTLAMLEDHKDMVLATTQFVGRSEFDDKVIPVENDFEFQHERSYRRFQELVKCKFAGKRPIWGLMRADVLKETTLIRSFIGSDDCLLIELGLKGDFGLVRERLATVRRHPESYTDMKKQNLGVEGVLESKWLDPDNNKRYYLPHWKRLREYFILAMNSNETNFAKLKMVFFLVYPIGWGWYKTLIKEVMFAYGLKSFYLWLKQVKKSFLKPVTRT